MDHTGQPPTAPSRLEKGDSAFGGACRSHTQAGMHLLFPQSERPVCLECRGEQEEVGLEGLQGGPQSCRAELRAWDFILPAMGRH